MNPPFAGLRLVLVAPVDDAELAHNGLVRRALERLGADLLHVDPEHAPLVERLVRRSLDRRLASALEQHGPEIILVAGAGIVPAEVVEHLRRNGGGRWVQLLGDAVPDPAGALREAMVYDDVFAGTSGYLAVLQRQGIRHGHYLAVGCDPSVHKPLRARGPFRANVVFAGSATSRRERLLGELVEFGLALWGPGWRRTALKDYCRGELPNTEDFVRAYAGATVGVNVHRYGPETRGSDTTGVNRRTFEIAAIGVPQVVDARGDLPRNFEDGSEVLVYETPEQLKGQVKRAIQEDKYRERLAHNARQRAIRQHTYMHRMADLLSALTGRAVRHSGDAAAGAP
ncbi:MAG TPA: glycosyltransferase [Gemmatimonadales bacterium]|nr:glycosyltransferase [Gemmatimonadales bacterium]